MCIHFDSNYKAITQAINYFSVQSGGQINKLKAIKLVFFADRYHLRKYGRPITGDSYFAMHYGPVGTLAKDIAQQSPFLDKNEKEYSQEYLMPSVDSLAVSSSADFNPDPLSDSDIEALEFAWNHFNQFDPFQLAEITHAYPEWKKFKEKIQKTETGRQDMDYEDFFEDPDLDDPNLALLNNSDPFIEAISNEQKNCALEIAKEYSAIRKRWRR